MRPPFVSLAIVMSITASLPGAIGPTGADPSGHEQVSLPAITSMPTFAEVSSATFVQMTRTALRSGRRRLRSGRQAEGEARSRCPRPTTLPQSTSASTQIDFDTRPSAPGRRPAHLRHADARSPAPVAERDDRIMQEYNLPPGSHFDWEVDHLIPLCRGGADDDRKLWPQIGARSRRSGMPSGKTSSKLANANLHAAAKSTCGEAQKEISDDWIEAYQRRIGEPR